MNKTVHLEPLFPDAPGNIFDSRTLFKISKWANRSDKTETLSALCCTPCVAPVATRREMLWFSTQGVPNINTLGFLTYIEIDSIGKACRFVVKGYRRGCSRKTEGCWCIRGRESKWGWSWEKVHKVIFLKSMSSTLGRIKPLRGPGPSQRSRAPVGPSKPLHGLD